MAPNDLIELLRRQPFEPFRIRLVSGAEFEVKHSENAEVRLTVVWLFNLLPNKSLPTASTKVIVVLRNIAYIDFPLREPSS